jgi:hypothetical protein
MKRTNAWWLLAGLLPCALANAEVPYTFAAGDPIRASELNANFQYLDSKSSGGSGGPLVRRRATLRTSTFNEVVTVPDTATDGWVLRSVVTGCGAPVLRIDNDPNVVLTEDAVLVVRPGETLYARCAQSATTDSSVGYFMFDEQ